MFDYQSELSKEIVHLMNSKKSGFISLPTGAGKTRTAVHALLDASRNFANFRVVWMAPSIELLDQAHKTIEQLWKEFGSAPNLSITRDNGNFEFPHGVWLTTPQLVNARDLSMGGVWDGVIFDEAHQMQAETFQGAVNKIKQGNQGFFLIGLSATPGRSNELEIKSLAELFSNNLVVSSILGNQPVKFLQDRGVLSRLDFKWLSVAASEENRLKIVYEKCIELSSIGKKTLVFMGNLRDAEALALALRTSGFSAWYVDGNTSDQSRRSRLKEFADAKAGILTNQKLLTTGYDCPAVSDVILGSKVGSAIQFEQMVGRAARGPRTGGARKSTIWQFDDHLLLHGEPRAHIRFLGGDWRIVENDS